MPALRARRAGAADAMARDDEPRGPAAPATAEPGGLDLDLLYREQAPRLTRRLRARLRSGEEARDLVQDAFARLIGASARRAIARPEAFLNRVVRNLLIDRARRLRTNAVHVPVEGEAEPAVRANQADAIELAQLRERYRTAVAALPPRTREVFVLHRIESLSYKDIAARLTISVRTVEWHMAEAIVRIGKSLGKA